MKHKIGPIGHVDHGKTTLSSVILVATSSASKMDIEIARAGRNINEIIEEDKSVKLTAHPIIELTQWDFKSGKESRRERRMKERKANRK